VVRAANNRTKGVKHHSKYISRQIRHWYIIFDLIHLSAAVNRII